MKSVYSVKLHSFDQKVIIFAVEAKHVASFHNYQTKMKGSDDEMNPRMSPAMDSKNKGHQKLNLGFGINLVNHNETLKNHRVGIEGIFPIYQRYRGIQMKETFRLTAGWQYAF